MVEVSVIIPVYNAEKTIEKTLKALLRQSFKGIYEIIPVDDGSTDETGKILESYSKKYSKIKLIHQKNSGPAAARNKGAKKSKGKILIFTDSDCIPEKNWIKEMIKPIENRVVGIQGRYKILNKESIMARFVQYEFEQRYQRTEKFEYIDFIGTYSAAYKRDVFMKLDGFDESFPKASGEDPDLSFRVEKAGYKMVFNPNAVVYHPHPETLKKYLKMKYGRGYWGRLLYKKHPEKKGDQSYNSPFYFMNIFLTGIFGLLFVVAIPFNVYASALFLFLLLLNSFIPSINIAKFEKKFILLGPILITLRNMSIGLGIVMGFLRLR